MPEKYCPRCNQSKSTDQFYSNARAKDGLQSYCKTCLNLAVKKTREKKPPRIGDVPPEIVLKAINTRAAPDGLGSFHWRYEGPQRTSQPPVTNAAKRIAELIDGNTLPDPVEFWCWDEFPWCVNPDHLTRHDEVPVVALEEITQAEYEGTKKTMAIGGYQLVTAPDAKTVSSSLRALEHIPFTAGTELERWADQFLAAHGYRTDGTPFRRKGGRDKA